MSEIQTENVDFINAENYITNHNFMSYSRLSRFIQCEAAVAAGYSEPSSVAQLVGSYVDAYFSNELNDFKLAHPEIINSRTGELKSDFKKADDIIKRIKNDETFSYFMSGEKQKIMTGKIAGMKFKIKIDSYLPGKFIVDLKVMKDFTRVWSDIFGRYTNFIEAYNYDLELAIFQEIVFQNTGEKLPCYIAAITKEEPSDLGIFEIPQNKLDEALEIVKHNIPRIEAVLSGKEAPNRCEKCNYCRSTKRARVLNWDLVGASGDKLREEGIESNDPMLVIKEEK